LFRSHPPAARAGSSAIAGLPIGGGWLSYRRFSRKCRYSCMTLALITLVLVWVGFIAYVVLGGADFGAGVWDLLATGPTARRQHEFISHVLGPVWEANHVWLIFLLVGLMNVFPLAFSAFMSALFVPLTIGL